LVILTPIDLNVYRPLDRAMACQILRLNPGRRFLLFVGRLDDSVKRVGALLRTFSELASTCPDVDLLIAGNGPDAERLQKQAVRLCPGRVSFLGWVSEPATKAQLYNVAECLVLP